MKREEWDNTKTLVFLLALAFTSYLTYAIHLDRPYPLHVDEWHHLALAKCTIDAEGVCRVNPYFLDRLEIVNLEGGFHTLLALLSIAGGIDLVLYHRILPALFACITAVILFAAVKRRLGFPAAFFSVVFMASIKSNINILGFMFFTPLTLALPLIYLLFYVVPEAVSQARREFVFAAAVAVSALSIIHPPSALALAPATALYILAKYRSVLAHKKFFAVLGVVLIVTAAFAVFSVYESKIKPYYVRVFGLPESDNISILKKLVVFDKKWRHVDIEYPLHEFYGIPQSILALLGFVFALKLGCGFILLWPLTSVIWLYAASASETQWFVSYQRILYYTLLSLVPLTALGAAKFVDLLIRVSTSRRLGGGAARVSAVAAAALIVASIVLYSFSGRFEMHPQAPLYDIMNDDEYAVLAGLKARHGEGNLVYTDKWTSVLVYPVSGSKVVHMVTANLWGRESDETDMAAFNEMSCDSKMDFVEERNVDFILTTDGIECGFLKLDDERGGNILYKVNL